MEERSFTTAEWIGVVTVVLILAAFGITAAGLWGQFWSQEAAGWAQAVGTAVAIVGASTVAHRVQGRQERNAARTAEAAYNDYLLLTLDLMTQAWATAVKVRDRKLFDLEFFSEMRVEAQVLASALEHLSVERMRGPQLVDALMVSISAARVFSLTVARTDSPNAFPALQEVRLRTEAGKAAEYLRVSRRRVFDALLVRGVDPLAIEKPGTAPCTKPAA